MRIRECLASDLTALETLYPAAFPDEDLLPLVRDLETGDAEIFSLIAENDDGVIGHIAFTLCQACESDEKLGLLAPLCVAPNHQKHGIGSTLIREGFQHLKERKVSKILVLGDPAYYSRFGFKPEKAILPPYPLPEEWADAWQSVSLRDPETEARGVLNLPELWRKPEYWGP